MRSTSFSPSLTLIAVSSPPPRTSHLKDAKTGKFVNAPLPQPTLPKISLRDDELYTGSEKGSIRGGVYPAPPPSFSGAGGGSEWGGRRKGTPFRPQDDRPFQQFQGSRPPFIQPTEPARYAYTSSDPNALRSGTSLAAVPSRREPNAFDSSTTLVGGEAGRGVPQRSQTNVTVGSGRPLSWGSGDDYSGGESEEKGYYDDDGFGYADEYGVPSQPLPVLGREEPRRYAPPSRQQQQQLYARATAPSEPPSEMEYTMRDEEGGAGAEHASFVSGYGGWEEGGQVSVAQEHYHAVVERRGTPARRREPSLDPGNLAGRGRPGR